MGGWYLATLWLGLSAALPLTAWLPGSDADPILLTLIVVTILASSSRLALLIARGVPRLTTGMLWFFVYVTAGVVPLAQTDTGLYPNLVDSRYLFATQVTVLLAAFCFELGGLLSRRRSASAASDTAATVSLKALRWVSIAAIPPTLYFISKLGGPAAFFESRERLAEQFTAAGLRSGGQASSALVTAFGQAPIAIVAIAWTVHYLRNPGTIGISGRLWLIGLLALNAIVNNPISNARYWFLAIVIGLIYSLPSMGPRVYRFSLIAAPTAALIAFPYSDYFRRIDRGPLTIGPLGETISTKDYDQAVMTANGLWYVAEHGHTWGQQLLGAIFFWVPRSAWEGKALDTGVLIGNYLDAGTVNLSSPLWTEFYVDFGWPGVALGFAALGFAAHRLDDTFVRLWSQRSQETFVLQLLLPLLAGYSLILLRGPLLQSMSRLAVILFVCWALTWGGGQRHETRADPQPTRKSGRPRKTAVATATPR